MCTTYKANLHYTKIKLFLEGFSIIHVVYDNILGCGMSALMIRENKKIWQVTQPSAPLMSGSHF